MPNCNSPIVSTFCNAAGSAVDAAASSGFEQVVQAFARGQAQVVKTLMTFWIDAPAVNVSGQSAVMAHLSQLTRPLTAFAAIIGLLFAGGRLVVAAHRGGGDGQRFVRAGLTTVVVTFGGTAIVSVLVSAFDAIAVHLLDGGFDGTKIADRLAKLDLVAAAAGPAGQQGSGLIFVLALLGILASLGQLLAMILRWPVLLVLLGFLPVAAASSITDTGWAWFKRLAGWIFSFTIYKLVAAVIYATAFVLIGDTTELTGIISGFALIIVAVLALPALMRLLPPSVAAIGGGAGGGAAGAAAAVATGAVSLPRGIGSSAPPATHTPGLKAQSNPAPSGSATNAGGGRIATSDPGKAAGAGSTGAGAAAAGASGGAGGAGGASAAGSAAGAGAAAGPAGAAVGVGVEVVKGVHSAAKSKTSEATGPDGSVANG